MRRKIYKLAHFSTGNPTFKAMQELVKGIKLNFLGNAFRALRAAFVFLAAWRYGSENFGVYTIAWATAELLMRFGTLGLEKGLLFDLAYLRSQEEKEKLYDKIAASLNAALGLSLLVTAGFVFYSWKWVETPSIQTSLYISAPFIPVYVLANLFLHCTLGMKNMKFQVLIRDILEPLIMIPTLFLFYSLPSLRPYGIILSQCLALMVSLFLSLLAFQKFFSLKSLIPHLFSTRNYFELLRYSFPMYLIEIFDAILFRMDLYLLSAYLGTGTAEQKSLLGVYGLAKQVSRILTHSKNAFAAIFVPVTSETFLAKRVADLWKTVRYSTEKLLLLNGVLALGLVLFGRKILGIFGSDIEGISQGTFLWLVAGQFFYSTFGLLNYFLVVTFRSQAFLGFHLLFLVLAAILGWWAVPAWGTLGAAMATGVAYILVACTATGESLRYFIGSVAPSERRGELRW